MQLFYGARLKGAGGHCMMCSMPTREWKTRGAVFQIETFNAPPTPFASATPVHIPSPKVLVHGEHAVICYCGTVDREHGTTLSSSLTFKPPLLNTT